MSLAPDGGLRMQPLSELASLRVDPIVINDVLVEPTDTDAAALAADPLVQLDGDSFEIQITVDPAQIQRKRFGLQLFCDKSHAGLPILFLPEYGRLRVGSTEAPFSVGELDEGEDLVLHIFVDKYLVEVFVNDRQAVANAYMDYLSASYLRPYSFHESTTLRKVEIWRLRATNQGFFEARDSRIWAVDEE